MTCVLVPNIVRWRFMGTSTTIERFIGSDRGLRRNTFGRLWWRTYLLQQPHLEHPYQLFNLLTEDDLVQVTERTGIAASSNLATAFCTAFLRAAQQHEALSRRTLLREAIKRLQRLLAMLSFTALDRITLDQTLDTVFAQTAQALIASTE
ncbi:MAG: hypothetical protein H0X37_03710 [Herpetosiphonaceae bacterium]|nr:hypothetical protein [Herpetosiphonaceae bacterium]